MFFYVLFENQTMTMPSSFILPTDPAYNPEGLPLAASVILLNSIDHVLVVTRRTNDLTNLPGGKRDEGESAAENAVRETGEECGVQVPLEALIPIYSGVCEADPSGPKPNQRYWVDCFVAYYDISFGTPREIEPKIIPWWVHRDPFVTNSAFPLYNQALLKRLDEEGVWKFTPLSQKTIKI